MSDIGSLIKFLLVWAVVGAIATLGGLAWGIAWLVQHVRFA